ncbi:flagellar biosynthesis protein FlhF [Thiomonas sp.]|uniref:flagellar biosynthesis protein FlhF n=1 Tax=Thiomonas sp. TaxID=2047785 RepID=UPI0026222242|nr:flagellar biosynthesis protein FlhF [Thiomonas sp.]
MKIKRYTGTSTREVLARIRGDLGPDAVILSNREIVGGVELMAAVDFDAASLQPDAEADAGPDERRAEAPAARPGGAMASPSASPAQAGARALSARSSASDAAGAVKPSQRQQSVAAAPSSRPSTPAAVRARDAAPKPAPAAPAPAVWAGEIRELRDELEELREWVRASVAQAPVGSPSAIELRLQALGLDARAAREAAAGARDVDQALDAWLAGVELREDPMREPGVYALVGATGVGKTTTIAKIAARLVLRHGTESVALVTTDTYRIGGVEQLRIYGRILGVPVAVARDAAELRAHLQAFSDRSFVLVDTIGLSPRDARMAEQLRWLGEQGTAVRALLLLGAGMSLAVYEQAWQTYRQLPLAGCILTKLDETAVFGAALQWLREHAQPLWFYTDGQRVPEDLHAPEVAKMKALLQRGPAAARADESALRPGRDDAAPAVANSR